MFFYCLYNDQIVGEISLHILFSSKCLLRNCTTKQERKNSQYKRVAIETRMSKQEGCTQCIFFRSSNLKTEMLTNNPGQGGTEHRLTDSHCIIFDMRCMPLVCFAIYYFPSLTKDVVFFFYFSSLLQNVSLPTNKSITVSKW